MGGCCDLGMCEYLGRQGNVKSWGRRDWSKMGKIGRFEEVDCDDSKGWILEERDGVGSMDCEEK